MRPLATWVPLVVVSCSAALALHCGSNGNEASSPPNDAGQPDSTGSTPPVFADAASTFADFPAGAQVDGTLPGDIGQQFDQAASGGDGGSASGPCITEPQDDAMVPRNWSPLFIEWNLPSAQSVTEIRITVDNQDHPYVAYVPGKSFTMAASLWSVLARHSSGHDLVVSLRSAVLTSGKLAGPPSLPTRSTLHIAPVDAPGSVVYWSSSPETSFKGFAIGDVASKVVLTPQTAGVTSTGGQTTCVSCHTSSVDGKLVFYTRDVVDVSRSVDVRTVGSSAPPSPTDVSPQALALLGRNLQYAPQVSPAHASPTDSVALTVFKMGTVGELIWTDLHAVDANGWGVIARTGDPRNVSSPAWRHDGTAIAYTSSAGGGEGVIADSTPADPTMDIYTVPYGDRRGGPALPLAGASDPALREFYPSYSPSDTVVVFNRTSSPVSSYNQPSAELAVVPAEGGSATRLRANDPAACSGRSSPGLTNSWPRWAPKVGAVNDLRYYWLVFSSIRRAATAARPQLYVSALVTRAAGGKESLVAEYPAVYVTAQDPAANNHIPAWDAFDVATTPR